MKTPKLLILLLSIALFACEANKVEELEINGERIPFISPILSMSTGMSTT